MERKIPGFVLVHKGVIYIFIGETYAESIERKHDSLIRRPRRLG